MSTRMSISLFSMFLSFAVSFNALAEVSEDLLEQAEKSIAEGVEYLLAQQADNGAWGREPAITALAMQALYQNQMEEFEGEIDQALEKGREFILEHQQPSGAFFGVAGEYPNYTTSMALVALDMLDRPEDEEAMRQARNFLQELQLREEHDEHPREPDSPFYGGIGYGSGGATVPDLSNPQFALEALYLTDHLDRDTAEAEESRATWRRAEIYLRSVQHIPEDADDDWQPDPDSVIDGGFVYRPDQCRIREATTDEFEGEPISYGATTVGGLKSLLYAGVERDDPRVRAAVNWLKQNYTLDENPVIGPEAHYYYLWTFAKAMRAYGRGTLELADGEERDWREDLMNKLIELQRQDGSWINEEAARYMESVPELTTSYSLIGMRVALSDASAQ